MKRQPRLTKREKKAATPAAPRAGGHAHAGHIHCIACGRHIDPHEFDARTAMIVTCEHNSSFPSCTKCELTSRRLLEEHDRTGQPVKTANAWH
jgi:hypothetical protein